MAVRRLTMEVSTSDSTCALQFRRHQIDLRDVARLETVAADAKQLVTGIHETLFRWVQCLALALQGVDKRQSAD